MGNTPCKNGMERFIVRNWVVSTLVMLHNKVIIYKEKF